MAPAPRPPEPGRDPIPLPGAAIVRQVEAQGVADRRVLDAMARLSRARFLPPRQRGHAVEDRALPIGLDQTISQPLMVAVMTAELALEGGERVLEIGTGSGYQAAVLAAIAAEVFTVERHALLSLRARSVLDGLGLTNVRYRIGDGSLGWPEEAPFDRVLVTAAAPDFPNALFDQLREGGILVAPIGPEHEQELTSIRKRGGKPEARAILPCRFVKLVGEQGWGEE